MNKITKITIVGDIMCEPMLMKASIRPGNRRDFNDVFEHVRDLFSEADYVVGNLETPTAGEAMGYTSGFFSFNAPEEILEAIHNAGIKLVTTANNHCLDRGVDGLKKTMQTLERYEIPYTGTFLNPEEPRYYLKELGGIKVAFLNYTYGTNYAANRTLLKNEERHLLNMLRPQEEYYFLSNSETDQKKKHSAFTALLSHERKAKIKKLLGKPYNVAHEDNNLNQETVAPYMDELERAIRVARNEADVVLFLPHMGGQFNLRPGAFSRYIAEKAVEFGCDAVVASHAHVVQEAVLLRGIPCFYSIGNFSMSPNSYYLLHDHLPEYGLAVHLYLEERQVSRVTFSILKIIETKKKMLTVWPVDELAKKLEKKEELDRLEKEIAQIYAAVTGKRCKGISREYEFELS